MPILKILTFFSNNRITQRLLEKNIQLSKYLTGIGSGADVTLSGEEKTFRLMMNCLRPPYRIFDIGANKGQYVQVAQKIMSNITYCIHCFEPSKASYTELIKKYKTNPNIRTNRLALGKRKGTAKLYYDKPGSKISSLTKRKLHHFNIYFDKHEEVEIETVDNYCLNNSIDQIHLMKIDVEGHELDVITGAKNVLEKRGIDIITFEFGGCNIDTRTFFQDFYYLLCEEFRMKIYRLAPSGYLLPIVHYKEIYEQFQTTNYIAIRQELTL